MAGPTIGVVVPAFNAARFLEQTLISVRDQHYVDVLCCIVDDGSTDETAAIAARFCALDSRFRLVSQPNLGQTSACNRGLAELADQIDYVCFLDADDVLYGDALSTLSKAAESDLTTVGAHGLATRIDTNGQQLPELRFEVFGRNRFDVAGGRSRVGESRVKSAHEPTTFQSLAILDTLIPPSVVLIRSSALARTSGFDPTLAWWPDWDLFLRLARLGDLAFVDQVVVDYRLHDTNMSRAAKFAAAARVVRIRAFESAENTAEQRRACHRAWRISEGWHAGGNWADCHNAIRQRSWRPAAIALLKTAVSAGRWLAGRPTGLLRDKSR